jgi:hypothetical protein
MSHFPFVTWQVGGVSRTISTTVQIAGGGGPTTESLTFNPGAAMLWGWRTASGISGRAAATDSVAYALRTMLLTHTLLSNIEPSYEFANNVRQPIWRMGSSQQYTVEFNTAIPELGIFSGDVLNNVELGGAFATGTRRRWAGVWAPGVPGGSLEPVLVDDGTTTRNPYNPSVFDRLRVAQRRVFLTEWPYVEALDITSAFRSEPEEAHYRTLAQRIASDRLGTLEHLLAAAGEGRRFRLVNGFGAATGTEMEATAYECSFLGDGELRRDQFTREETVGGRRYRVVMSFLGANSGANLVEAG